MQKLKKLFPIICGLFIAVALLGVFATHPKVSSADADKTVTLEDRVKSLGLPYKALDGGKFLVAFSVDDTGSTNIIVGESALRGNEKLKMITLTALIQEGSKAKKLPENVMAQIADFDYQTDIGRVGVDAENNIWYQSSLWEATATNETFIYDMLFAHVNRQKLSKQFKAANEEG